MGTGGHGVSCAHGDMCDRDGDMVTMGHMYVTGLG